MASLRSLLGGRPTTKDTRDANPDEYEPLRTSSDDVVDAEATDHREREGEGEGEGQGQGQGQGRRDDDDDDDGETHKTAQVPFSWFEYTIFALVGVAMLWAWNMFLAASPYFNSRLRARPSLSRTFQSLVLSVSTITNLVATSLLSKLQRTAHYANRIKLALVINTAAFVLLTISTAAFRDVSPDLYLAFVLADVCLAALATGLFQNGAFAFAASFGRGEYTQAVMVGQALAGVLPALAQMISVLVVPSIGATPLPQPGDGGGGGDGQKKPDDPIGHAAFLYFFTAVLVSLLTLVSFFPLATRHARLTAARLRAASSATNSHPPPRRQVVGFAELFRKLRWEAGAAAICFVATIAFFPVFTSKILSTHAPPHARLFDTEVFVPLGFLCWNLGDLLGRVFTGGRFNEAVRRRPAVLFLFGCARFLVLPLYLLCNLHGNGAVVASDLFYLVVVQLPFGLSNGWLASNAMMAAAESVDEGEREAAGGFMGLCLVAGLAMGSLVSFTVTDI